MDDILNINQHQLPTTSQEIDKELIEQKETDLALSDLDDLAYSINLEFDSYIKSTGAPIAQNLRTFDIFTFNINMLLKYSSN